MSNPDDQFQWSMTSVDEELPLPPSAGPLQESGYPATTGPMPSYREPEPEPRRRSSVPVGILVTVVGVIAAFGGGLAFGIRSFDNGDAAAAVGSSETEDDSINDVGSTPIVTDPELNDGSESSAGTETVPAETDGAETGSADTGEGDDATAQSGGLLSSVEPTAENPTGAIRYVIYQDGTAFLRGLARDDEAIDRLTTSFAAVFGSENIVNEYEVNPAAPRWTDAPIYFDDVVLFDLSSSDIRPEFLPLLEQTALLLDQGPFVSITIFGKTDASGSAVFNERLAQARVASVLDYLVDELGVDEFRVQTVVVGESESDPNADDDLAAQERRVEVVVSGVRG